VLAFNYDLQAAVRNDAGTWDRIDDVPMRRGECYPTARPVASGIVASCQGIAWFNATTQRWHAIESPPGTESVVIALEQSLLALHSNGPTTELVRLALPSAR
jgi:hypothetical protein